MNKVTEHIKECIKQINIKTMNSDKLKIISSYGYYKIYYNSDFICYLDINSINNVSDNNRSYAIEVTKELSNYNENMKKKPHPVILCITNSNKELIEYIIKTLNEQRYLKLILIGPNDNYVKLAYKYNTDYIISPKNEYHIMIQTGLTYIRNSTFFSDKILITNTDTLLNISSLLLTFSKFNQFFGFAGSNNMKLIEQKSNKIDDINIYNISMQDKLFFCNWFMIERKALDILNWNLFGGSLNMYDLLDAYMKRFKFKLLNIEKMAICFNYIKNNRIKKSDKINIIDQIEYKMVSDFLNTHNNEIIRKRLDNVIINKALILPNMLSEPAIKNKSSTNDNMFKTFSKPKTRSMYNLNEIHNFNNTMKLSIDKYYFITMSQDSVKIKDLDGIDKLNYNIINDDNKNRYNNHMIAIKDALTRRFQNIVIIEDKLISNDILNIFRKNETLPNTWQILIIVPLKSDNKLLQLTSSDKTIYNFTSLSYCINNYVYSEYITLLNSRKNVYDALFELQKKFHVYLIYDNFNNNVILNRGNRILENNKTLIKVSKNTVPDQEKDRIVLTIGNKDQKELKHTLKLNKEVNNLIKNTLGTKIQNDTIYKLDPNIILSNEQKTLLTINNIGTSSQPVLRKQAPDIYLNTPSTPTFSYHSHQSSGTSISQHNNKIVQGLWIGEELSLNEILCISSFIKNGHEFHLYVYDKIKNIPNKCIVKDANEILPETDIFYYNEKQSISGEKRPTAFSNMFRYKLLYDKGNYWVDMDMICIKYLNFNEPYVFSSESTFLRDQIANAGIIKCPKGCDFAKYCYEVCLKKDKSKLKWGEIGPKLVAEGIAKYKLQTYIKPWTYFCPIGYDKINDLITPANALTNFSNEWYCIHLWNELWIKKKLNKNKIYYGSLFGNLVNKYCKEYINHEIFNLELKYGKYNKSCVLFYWMPEDKVMVNEMETILGLPNYKSFYNIETCYIHKENAIADNNRINQFIHGDIYAYMFSRMIELGIIDNLHIIFGMAKNDKYVYNNEPLFTGGNYYNFNDKIFLWKLNDIKSLLSFANAKIYFYKGTGHYEHLYSMLTEISPHSIFTRYLATAPRYTKKNHNIIIDDNWVHEYAKNDICKSKIKHFNNYFHKSYTSYDFLFIDTVEKIPHYKKLFVNTKEFVKLHKYSLMNYDPDTKREYDLLFCASDTHPSKNWEILYNFLMYCDRTKKPLSVLIITPVVKDQSLNKYQNIRNIKITIQKGLTKEEMNSCLNKCKCLLITFGRDANPRVMSESLSCGCYNIILDILSDGKDVIKDRPLLGKLIQIPQKNISYVHEYNSVTCTLTNDQHDEIYKLIKKEHDHDLIATNFYKLYNPENITNEIYKHINRIAETKQKLIVTLATEDYSNNMNYLLSSIKHTNPNQSVLVFYVGWRDELINEFIKYYPTYHFEEIKLNNYKKDDIIKLKVKLQHDIYFKFRLPFVWIDADSIVLRDLSPLFDKIKHNTLICYYRPNEPFYMKFAVGVIAFGLCDDEEQQEINENFIKSYFEHCNTTLGHNDWFYDQTSLHETYNDYEDKIKLYCLSENEHSINDTTDTIVYSRRLNNKKTLRDILSSFNIKLENINFTGINMKYD